METTVETIDADRAGLAALIAPSFVGVVAVALIAVGGSGDDLADLANVVAGLALLVVAAPTTWLVVILPVDLPGWGVVAFGLLTSLPLWFWFGAAQAKRSATWRIWTLRYAGRLMLVWGVSLIAVVVLGQL